MKNKKIIGFKGTLDAIKKNILLKAIVDPDKRSHAKVREIIKSGVPIEWKKTPNVVEGIVERVSSESILDNIGSREEATILALDSIQDTGNFGAIIRSADAFGVDLIVIPKRNSVQVSDTVAKISAGSIANVEILEVTNLVHFLEKVKTLGFWVYGAEANGNTDYRNAFRKKSCIVMGSEANGMRDLVKKTCDFTVSIPIRIESLNVAHACSILLCENYNGVKD